MPFATPEATKSCHEDFPQLNYSELGQTGLHVSDAGLGMYRMSNQNPDHVNAIRRALLFGINLIDTSSNYMDGDAERLVGEALRVNNIDREKVVIVTKGGYLPKDQATAEQMKAKSFTSLDDKMGHSLDPDFIRSQIHQSLERMELDCIDIYLIHNPEYYLKQLLSSEENEKTAQEKFYDQIGKVFEVLESEVKKGNIQYYGISSNTLIGKPTDPERVSFKLCLDLANIISPDHHFKVCQFPFNFCEHDAAVSLEGKEPLLDQLKAAGLGTLTNRPFNTILNGEFVHLKDVLVEKEVSNMGELEPFFEKVSGLEDEIRDKILLKCSDNEEEIKKLYQTIAMTGVLYGMMDDRHNYDTFRDALLHYGLPKVEIGITAIAPYLEDNYEDKQTVLYYYSAVNRCFEQMSHYYKSKKAPIIEKIKEIIFSLRELNPHSTLSSISFSLLRETKGVDCVLVGMRHEAYVEHIIGECEKGHHFDSTPEFWEKVHEKSKKILTN